MFPNFILVSEGALLRLSFSQRDTWRKVTHYDFTSLHCHLLDGAGVDIQICEQHMNKCHDFPSSDEKERWRNCGWMDNKTVLKTHRVSVFAQDENSALSSLRLFSPSCLFACVPVTLPAASVARFPPLVYTRDETLMGDDPWMLSFHRNTNSACRKSRRAAAVLSTWLKAEISHLSSVPLLATPAATNRGLSEAPISGSRHSFIVWLKWKNNVEFWSMNRCLFWTLISKKTCCASKWSLGKWLSRGNNPGNRLSPTMLTGFVNGGQFQKVSGRDWLSIFRF